MKWLTTLLIVVGVILTALAAHSTIVSWLDTNEYYPPIEQQQEAADAPEWVDHAEGLESDRSGRWPTVRKHFVEAHPECAACGSTENLNVHHIKPFHEYPELELEESNLIVLCRGTKERHYLNCHFYIGHDPDGPSGPLTPNWKRSNPNVREDARKMRDNLGIAL